MMVALFRFQVNHTIRCATSASFDKRRHFRFKIAKQHYVLCADILLQTAAGLVTNYERTFQPISIFACPHRDDVPVEVKLRAKGRYLFAFK